MWISWYYGLFAWFSFVGWSIAIRIAEYPTSARFTRLFSIISGLKNVTLRILSMSLILIHPPLLAPTMSFRSCHFSQKLSHSNLDQNCLIYPPSFRHTYPVFRDQNLKIHIRFSKIEKDQNTVIIWSRNSSWARRTVDLNFTLILCRKNNP